MFSLLLMNTNVQSLSLVTRALNLNSNLHHLITVIANSKGNERSKKP